MKRSKKLKLAIMGISPIALTACSEKPVDMLVYKSLEECGKDRHYSLDQCKAEFDKVTKEHRKTAPMYRRLTDCENDVGRNRCESLGRFFSPMIAAYMLRMPAQTNGQNNYYGSGMGISQPLYTSRDDPGHYRTGDNKTLGKTNQRGKISTTPSKTRSPSVKTTTVSRGGFGSQAAARGGWGGGGKSFGG